MSGILLGSQIHIQSANLKYEWHKRLCPSLVGEVFVWKVPQQETFLL